MLCFLILFFFFSSRRRHTRCSRDWSSDVCSSDLRPPPPGDHREEPSIAGAQRGVAQPEQEENAGRVIEQWPWRAIPVGSIRVHVEGQRGVPKLVDQDGDHVLSGGLLQALQPAG